MSFDKLSQPSTLEILDRNKTKPINLTQVEVFGGDEFSNNFFNKLLSPLLVSSSMTINQLISNCNKSLNALSYTNCFDKVSFEVTQTASTASEGKPIDLTAKINLSQIKPTHFIVGSTHTPIGNILNASYINSNTFGNAEYFKITTALDSPFDKSTHDLNVTYKAPMVDTSLKLFANISSQNTQNPLYQSLSQSLINGQIGLEKSMNFKNGLKQKTTIELNLSKRTTLQINDSAHDEVKTFAGENTKISTIFKNTINNFKFLTKSDSAIPVGGFEVEFENEMGSYNSNDNDGFYKGEIKSRLVKSILHNGLSLDCSIGAGLLNKFNNSNVFHYQDKFFLNIPGYQSLPTTPSSLATSTDEKIVSDKVGGLAFLSYDVKLLSRVLLINSESPLRLYLGLKGGELFHDLSLKSNSSKNWKNGCTVGLSYKVGSTIDLDLYYKVPVVAKSIVGGDGDFGFSVSISGDY